MPAHAAYNPQAGPNGHAEIGVLLRQARTTARMKLETVAQSTGTSAATISLLERGKRTVSPSLLERIVTTVGADPAEVFRLAGTVPPHVATELLGPDLGGVVEQGHLRSDVRLQLRRLRLGEIADEATGQLSEPPVDFHRMLRSRFARTVTETAGLAWPRFGAQVLEVPATGGREELQRQLAHMAAHALIAAERDQEPACHFTAGGGDEDDAEWLGGLLAMPRRLLRRRFRHAVMRFRDEMPTAPPSAILQAALTDVASEFAMPLWCTMRHVADEDLLEWLFEAAE